MKYCRSCRHLNVGDQQFCGKCGRSYDVRLCPRLHINPVHASACSECGSKELSSPQATASALSRGITVIAFAVGLILIAASLFYIVRFIQVLFRDLSPSLSLMLIGAGLGLAWLLFVLPRGRD